MKHLHKHPYRRRNFSKISYASRVIANFVPNFAAMATNVDWKKMQLAAFDGAFSRNIYKRKNFAKIFYPSRVIAHFVPNFVATVTGLVGRKYSWQHSMAHL